MKYRSLAATILLAFTTGFAQHCRAQASEVKAILIPGLGNLQHPVTTTNPEAQRFFDQGLSLVYAFYHEGASQSFRRAAELDPSMAMAYWGIALAAGPNYNVPANAEGEKIAFENIQKALALAPSAPEHERAYIGALAKRYTNASRPDYHALDVAYRDAMRDLSRRFPDDLDAAVLYAESMMILHRWALWNRDGTPAEGTEEIVSVLESVLARDPNHIGAVHYYVHAMEASPYPGRALAAANKLTSLAPGAGHLLHMPGHIFARTGLYDDAVSTNLNAASVDEPYARTPGVMGRVPMMSYRHDLEFIVYAAAMGGRYAVAKEAAKREAEFVATHLNEMPQWEIHMAHTLTVLIRFERWQEILNMPEPKPELKFTSAIWHFARGMALVSTGKVQEAESEQKILTAIEAATPEDAIFRAPFNNKTKDMLKIACRVLAAKIAAARADNTQAILFFEQAIQIQDSLNYSEPPDWYYPVRESFGRLLLTTGDPKRAEQIFRVDLEKNPRNGRSLFGLAESLTAQGRRYDAELVMRQFEDVWKDADVQLETSKVTVDK